MVFIDYENVVKSARSRFHPQGSSYIDGHIDPGAIADLVVSRRSGPCAVEQIRVYRGRPSPNHQPSAAAANDRQTSNWLRDPRVWVLRRDLRYPPDYPRRPAQEKGVDVALAVDLVRFALERRYDVGVVLSRDTDLLPALEAVVELQLAEVEVAGWRNMSRVRFPSSARPWCHFLDGEDYDEVRDTTDYVKGRHA